MGLLWGSRADFVRKILISGNAESETEIMYKLKNLEIEKFMHPRSHWIPAAPPFRGHMKLTKLAEIQTLGTAGRSQYLNLRCV